MEILENAQPNAEQETLSGAEAVSQEELSPARQALAQLLTDEDGSAEADQSAAARARDQNGRFAKGDGAKPEIGATATKPGQEITSQDDPTKVTPAVSEPAGGPPVGWDADAKAMWPKLPPAIQAAVSRREKEVSDGFRQKSEELRMWTGVDDLLKPHREKFASWGARNDGEAIHHLLTFAEAYDRSPALLIQHLAAHSGIDLRQLAENPAQPQAPRAPQADPAILGKLSELEQQVQEFTSGTINSTLKAFGSKSEHAHFNDVREEMGRLIGNGLVDGDTPEEVLAAAYERAVWSIPSIREKVLAEREQKTQATRQEQMKAKADASRRAAVSLPRGTPNGSASNPGSYEGGSAARAALAHLTGGA